MFKKKNRSTARSTIRKTESSSEDDSLPPLRSGVSASFLSAKQSIQNGSAGENTSSVPKMPVYSSRRSKFQNQQSAFFSSNKPKFTTKLDLHREYDLSKTTDGLESMMGTEEVVTNVDLEQMEVNSNEEGKKPPIETPQAASEEFIAVPKTSSFRASLRKRNAMLTSDSSDSDERDASLEEMPVYATEETPQFQTNTQDITQAPLWEASDLSESTSDDEAKWEQSLVRRAAAMPSRISSSHASMATVDPPSEFTVVSQEHIMNRLHGALNDMRVSYDEDARTVMRTEREVEEIDKDEATEHQDKKDMEMRYEFYQQQCDYFRRLSGYLTDKRKELEELYHQYCETCKQYKAHNDIVNSLYMNDDINFLTDLGCFVANVGETPSIPSIGDIRRLSGRFFKSELYYDLQMTQTRNQDRCTYIDGPQIIRDSIQEIKVDQKEMHVITADADVYLNNVMYYNYDDDSTSMFLNALNEIRDKVDNVFDDRAYGYMRLDRILEHFQTWRQRFPEDYENAYISLSIHEFIIPVIIPSLLHFDPLGLQGTDVEGNTDLELGRIESTRFFSSLHEMPWFQPLKSYCEDTIISRDSTILPRLIQKCVISFVNDIILFTWNPLSIRETASLQKLLIELAGFFTTVTEELRAVYSNVSQRFSEAMNNSIYCVCSLYSEQTEDIQTDAQELVELYLTRAIRLLEGINMLASFMQLGTPAPFIDFIVTKICSILGGMASTPCLIPKCKVFASKVNSLIPDQVENAKQMISHFL